MTPIIIFILTVAFYIPLAGSLLFVWWKFGSGEIKVALARLIFLIVSFSLFGLLIII